MAKQYDFKNIRALLIEGFTDEELRILCFDVPVFKPVYSQLAKGTGKTEVVQQLLEFAEQKELIETLLNQAKKDNPAKYEKYQPYEVVTVEIPPAGAEPGFLVRHNLPQPDYARFVGRKAELKQIGQLLLPKTRHFVVTIDGIGGIGKSALALEVAHTYRRHADNLPEAERFAALIWTSAKQTVLTGEGIALRAQALRTLDDIYSAIAITLEREDITRARPEEQDELVRRALSQQRTLLIVDNLETVDDERVLTFIREVPEPTKVIVTTRHRLDVAYSDPTIKFNK